MAVKKSPHEQFKILLEKYNAGALTPQEKALMEEWIEVLGELESEHTLSEKDKLELKSKLETYIQKTKKQTESPTIAIRPWYVTPLKVAASLLLLATLSFLTWQITQRTASEKPAIVQTVSSGEIKKVMLSDGSIVWLKGESTITYPSVFEGKERQVTLTGEALFEIAKDPAHPFVIQCGDLTAKVLGTSFNIRANADNIEVIVLTGKVALSSKGSTTSLVVLPHEKAIYNTSQNQMAKVVTEEKESTETITRTEYNMQFKDTRMHEIIQRIEGKFNVKVIMDNNSIGNCRVTADFTDQSLNHTLEMIAQILEFKYEIKNKNVMISGEGCN